MGIPALIALAKPVLESLFAVGTSAALWTAADMAVQAATSTDSDDRITDQEDATEVILSFYMKHDVTVKRMLAGNEEGLFQPDVLALFMDAQLTVGAVSYVEEPTPGFVETYQELVKLMTLAKGLLGSALDEQLRFRGSSGDSSRQDGQIYLGERTNVGGTGGGRQNNDFGRQGSTGGGAGSDEEELKGLFGDDDDFLSDLGGGGGGSTGGGDGGGYGDPTLADIGGGSSTDSSGLTDADTQEILRHADAVSSVRSRLGLGRDEVVAFMADLKTVLGLSNTKLAGASRINVSGRQR